MSPRGLKQDEKVNFYITEHLASAISHANALHSTPFYHNTYSKVRLRHQHIQQGVAKTPTHTVQQGVAKTPTHTAQQGVAKTPTHKAGRG